MLVTHQSHLADTWLASPTTSFEVEELLPPIGQSSDILDSLTKLSKNCQFSLAALLNQILPFMLEIVSLIQVLREMEEFN